MARLKIGQRVVINWDLVRQRHFDHKGVPYDLKYPEIYCWGGNQLKGKHWEVYDIQIKKNGAAQYRLSYYDKTWDGRVQKFKERSWVPPMYLTGFKELEEADYEEMV